MDIVSERHADGVVERHFTLAGVPGILWMPEGASSGPVPLILLGHPGGLDRMYPRLAARARSSAAAGFATATLELPGSGDRPRIAAAGLFAGSFIPEVMFDQARRVTIPVHVLLQWDDEGNDRQAALRLFDAFGSPEKSLYANMGGHTGVPAHAGEDAARFFARHLT